MAQGPGLGRGGHPGHPRPPTRRQDRRRPERRLTCEELALAKGLFVTGLGLEKVFFADRKSGRADSLLLTAERVPNSRGVLEAGFQPRLPGLGELAAAELVLLFGADLAAHFGEADISRALAPVHSKYLLAAHTGPLDGLVDTVLPVAVPAEKAGTYVNVDGLRQSFVCAVRPPADVVSEGDILSCLGNSLGLNIGDADVR